MRHKPRITATHKSHPPRRTTGLSSISQLHDLNFTVSTSQTKVPKLQFTKQFPMHKEQIKKVPFCHKTPAKLSVMRGKPLSA